MGFSELLLNLYRGCSHGCWYCYNVQFLKEKNSSYRSYIERYDKLMEKATTENIEHDLMLLEENRIKMPIVISNWGDPYDMGRRPKGLSQYFSEDELKANPNLDSYVRKVLKIFQKYNHHFMILTKGGTKAVADFDLYGPNDWFGVTLTCDNDPDSLKNEPGAALSSDRIAALKVAHDRGIHTWVSLEPVLDPDQTLNLIERTHEFVDQFRVGKLNHFPERERLIDWPKFRGDAEARLLVFDKHQTREACGLGYLLDYQLINAR